MGALSRIAAGLGTPPNRRVLLIDATVSIHEDFRRILSGTDAASERDAVEDAMFGEVAGSIPATGFDLDSAYNGREGLEKVRAGVEVDRPYALVFVDMRMLPGWDGVETIRELWGVDPRLLVVICTAHSDYSWDEVLGTLGAEDRIFVLQKPFDHVGVARLASALTLKWELTRRTEAKLGHLEAAARERARELVIANEKLAALVHEVAQLAMRDALTGLPNRLLFAERAAKVLAAARQGDTRPVVLMLDLDRFREVNDTLGHQHGDVLLRQVAERLSGLLRASDTVARFGGDEFALLLTDGGPEAGEDVATRIARTLEEPFHLGEATVGVAASIGIASVAVHEEPTLKELLERADVALHKAKANRSGFAHFSAANGDGTPDRLTLVGELRQGLDREELVLYYQPKIAVDNGELLGVEALVRWQHPVRGLLLPGEFIALADEGMLFQRLTVQVVDMALRFCRSWLDQGLRLPIAVNVGARSLLAPDFPAIISDCLARAGVPGDLLTIELTLGTVMTDPDLAPGILQKLRDMGVRLSVDDYGTSDSSMAYLKDLPVDELKIDRAFISSLTRDHDDALTVRSAMDLGHNLGLSIVAEGVEDETTLVALKALGVDVAQGFHMGRPMPEDLLRRWMAYRSGASSAVREGLPPDTDKKIWAVS